MEHPWSYTYIESLPRLRLATALAELGNDLERANPTSRRCAALRESAERIMEVIEGPEPCFCHSTPIFHHHSEVIMHSAQPQVIVVNNGAVQPQQLAPGPAGAARTSAMTVNTREIKSLEEEKRRMRQQLEMKGHRREIEDLKRQMNDQDSASSTSYDRNYNQIQPANTTQAAASAPTRIDRRVDLYWHLGLLAADRPSATNIREAYKRCSMQHHPDRLRGKSDKEKAYSAERMREIRLAKSVLMGSEERKRAYDEEGVLGEGEFGEWKRRNEAKGIGGGGGGTFVATRNEEVEN